MSERFASAQDSHLACVGGGQNRTSRARFDCHRGIEQFKFEARLAWIWIWSLAFPARSNSRGWSEDYHSVSSLLATGEVFTDALSSLRHKLNIVHKVFGGLLTGVEDLGALIQLSPIQLDFSTGCRYVSMRVSVCSSWISTCLYVFLESPSVIERYWEQCFEKVFVFRTWWNTFFPRNEMPRLHREP